MWSRAPNQRPTTKLHQVNAWNNARQKETAKREDCEKTSHGSYAIWQTEETHFILEENLFSHFSLSKVNKLKYWHSLILF